jgi:glyoxylase-like metal-dependent hydrolase (beta-lactamase superfamily II)
LEILPGIHVVPGVHWSRVYLIEDESLALVDSGLPWNTGRILDYIKSIGRSPDELGLILITHSHPDHTAGARAISRRTGAEIVAHPADTKTHSRNEVSLSYMGAFTSLQLPLPFLQRTHVARTLADGQVLPVLGGIRVIHTPGHTRGSVCYLLESRSLLFTGDTAFSDGEGISRSVPFPGYNGRDYRQSLARLASLEFETLCGGHGSPLVGGASDRLRDLLAAKPEPPSWGGFIRSIPGRLYHAKSLHGED